MLRRFAAVFEGIVAAVFVVTVVLLFTNQPTDTSTSEAAALDAYGRPIGAVTDGSGAAAGPDGAAIFDDKCSSCHGASGGGGMGPALADGRVVERFPDVAEQIAVVTQGRGGMPKFGDRLTPEEIAAVVEFTRTSLTEG